MYYVRIPMYYVEKTIYCAGIPMHYVGTLLHDAGIPTLNAEKTEPDSTRATYRLRKTKILTG